jgi:hypothetical protein
LCNDLQLYYIELLKNNSIKQHLQQSLNGYEHKYWLPSNKCCVTGEILTKDNIDVKISYWTPFVWKPIRKDLRREAMRQEAYECQKIDNNCNDCLYLNRNELQCDKMNKKVKINPNICSPENVNCFKHRKDESSSSNTN